MASCILSRFALVLWLAAGLCLSCGQDGSRLDPQDLPSVVIKETRWSQTFKVSPEECPPVLCLNEQLRDPALALVWVDEVPIPSFSCADSAELLECPWVYHDACPCVATWSYRPQEDGCAGIIKFADHFDPCQQSTDGLVEITVMYIVAGC